MLLQYMMDLNQRRVGVVKKEIEDLIEADFISLDDYIFQIKWFSMNDSDEYKI